MILYAWYTRKIKDSIIILKITRIHAQMDSQQTSTRLSKKSYTQILLN